MDSAKPIETLEEKVARLEQENADLQSKLIYGFHEDGEPKYSQGPAQSEVQELADADEVNNIVGMISEYKRIVSNPEAVHLAMLRGDLQKPSEKLIKHLYANEKITEIDGDKVDLGLYEILDRTYTAMSSFDSHVVGHPRIEEFPEIQEKADRALQALFDLYQSVNW